jgi:hypothetical protein
MVLPRLLCGSECGSVTQEERRIDRDEMRFLGNAAGCRRIDNINNKVVGEKLYISRI